MHLFLAQMWGNSSVCVQQPGQDVGSPATISRSKPGALGDLFTKLGLGSTAAKSLCLALGEYQLAADEGSHLAN